MDAHPCHRKMAYGIMAEPGSNPQFDPLPSIIGTAVRTLARPPTAPAHANEALGRSVG